MSDIHPKISTMADLIRDEVVAGLESGIDDTSFIKSLEGAPVTLEQVLDVQEHIQTYSDAHWLAGGMHMVDRVIAENPGRACEYPVQVAVGQQTLNRIFGQDYDDGEHLVDGPVVTMDLIEVREDDMNIDPAVFRAVVDRHFDQDFDRVNRILDAEEAPVDA